MMQPDELDRVTCALLEDPEFKVDFLKQTTDRDQRESIIFYITKRFGGATRERSLVSERAGLVHYFSAVFSTPTPTTTKEADMNPTNAPAIETKTYIYGTLAANVSDDQIFGQVVALEQQIEQLDKTQNKSKKLAAKIDSLHADIKALNDFVDVRP